MAETLRVGIIGCGRRPAVDPATGRRTGSGIAESHARGYEATAGTQLVAAADINPEHLADFLDRHHLPASSGYTDYREMLAREALDIVSVCTWPALHAQMVVDAAEAGVQGILCEKPMALSLPDCERMIRACEARGVRLAVNHQRRFGEPFRYAKTLLQEGAIGDLLRVEGWVPRGTLLDWGTHWFDMFFFYLDQEPVRWVMGQADRREPRVLFGVPSETQSLTVWEYQNGVRGYMETGVDMRGQPANRLIGTEGMIEVGVAGPHAPPVRARVKGSGTWHVPDISEGIHGVQNFARSIAELVAAIREGREPFHSGRNGRQALEVIFAGYESAFRRRRVDLPLTVTDLPLERLIKAWEETA
jgi:predicted dehydrogenase